MFGYINQLIFKNLLILYNHAYFLNKIIIIQPIILFKLLFIGIKTTAIFAIIFTVKKYV